MDIKPEVWDHVMGFATELANESEPDRYATTYKDLHDYCEEQSLGGYEHPFLWETLADFTMDDGAAVSLYQRALKLAVGDEARAYRASIQFSLAERHKRLGDDAQAREYAVSADDEARAIDDRELRRRISRFLLSKE
ncbi:hypothetical protein [Dyella terrae]|uniref:hypothetical protein n=1 Tax=Dyella terrae TaxID=522259 RepID=UPI001EFE6B4C|nr:hypothetical protein [Dyella terrae]ULU24630.1 hypothetical protein DYST_01550 [Dyella terrae]